MKLESFKSKDKDKPDRIEIQVTNKDTFETQYGVCINAIMDGKESAISLHSFNSLNSSLLKLWNNNIENGKIQEGVKFTLLTYLGVSKNGRDIRRWIMEFNS